MQTAERAVLKRFTSEVSLALTKQYGSMGSIPLDVLAEYGMTRSLNARNLWQLHAIGTESVDARLVAKECIDLVHAKERSVRLRRAQKRIGGRGESSQNSFWNAEECLSYLRLILQYSVTREALEFLGLDEGILHPSKWRHPGPDALPSRESLEKAIPIFRKEFGLSRREKIPSLVAAFPRCDSEANSASTQLDWSWIEQQMKGAHRPIIILIPLVPATSVEFPFCDEDHIGLPLFEHRAAALLFAARLGWTGWSGEVELVRDSRDDLYGLSFDGTSVRRHPAQEAACRI